jgi:23S rRNA pseudouridine1911/1915/1917 synthase
MEILFLDNHLLAAEKPGGLLTQPSGTSADSLEAQAKHFLQQRFCKPGAVFLQAVHRLDRPVTGIVLFARTSKALSRLNQSSRQRDFRKVYLARVEGRPPQNTAVLEDWLVHDDFRARVAAAGSAGARLCRLQYTLLAEGRNSSLLEIILETGRYHQIRAQLAQLGNPILGDTRYGARQRWLPDAIALQHYRLSFRHPISQEEITLQANDQTVRLGLNRS